MRKMKTIEIEVKDSAGQIHFYGKSKSYDAAIKELQRLSKQ